MKFQTKLRVSSTVLSLSLVLCSSVALAGNDNHSNSGKSSSSYSKNDKNDNHKSFGGNGGSKGNNDGRDHNDGRGDDDDHHDHDNDHDSHHDNDHYSHHDNDSHHDDDDDHDGGWGNNNTNYGKIEICHRTFSNSNPWVLIKVSASAKQSHYDHGDPVQFNKLGNDKCSPVTTPPPAPTVTLGLAPAEIYAVTGQTTATWSSTNATSCTFGNGTLGTSGSTQFGGYPAPANVTITVTCTGLGGSTIATAPLSVVVAPLPPVELTVCSLLTSTSNLYSWAVDYYPSSGAFNGTSSTVGGPSIQGTISYTGNTSNSDILIPGKTITFTTGEIEGESTVGVTSLLATAGLPTSTPEAFFSVKLTTKVTNGTDIVGSGGVYISKTEQCFLPELL